MHQARKRAKLHETRRRLDTLVWHLHIAALLQPGRHGQGFFAQEFRVEQLRQITRTMIGEDGHDRMARAHVLCQPDRARDVDSGRAAQTQSFMLDQFEDYLHRLLVGNEIRPVDFDVFDDGGHAAKADALAWPWANRSYMAAPFGSAMPMTMPRFFSRR